jgi:hypothetical protein
LFLKGEEMKLKHIFDVASKAVVKKSPEIFIGIAIAGMGASVIFAVTQTPKAIHLLDEKKKELNTEHLTKKETVKATWKCYIPSAISFAVSTGLIIASNHIQNHRNAMLTAACSASESALLNYINKTKEAVGEEKEREIRSSANRERIKDSSVDEHAILNANGGDRLFIDAETGRYFRSDKETIRSVVNSVNSVINQTGSASLNTYYDFLGLERVARGDDRGWWAKGPDTSRYFVEVDFDWDESIDAVLVDFVNPPKEPTKEDICKYDIYW